MGKIKRGWALSKKSWGLLNENRELIRFPLYGAIATIPLAFVFLGPGLYFLDDGALAGAIPLLVIGLYVLSVVGTFFAVGLAAVADMIFRGEKATVGDGLAVARSRFSQICGWAALSTAIGVLMGALENQGGIAGKITGNLAIGGAVFLLGMLPSAILVAIGIAIWVSASFLGALLVVLGVIGFVVSMLISNALSGIFGVALYRYALDGEVKGGFTAEELESAVRTKGGRNAPPTATPGTV